MDKVLIYAANIIIIKLNTYLQKHYYINFLEGVQTYLRNQKVPLPCHIRTFPSIFCFGGIFFLIIYGQILS